MTNICVPPDHDIANKFVSVIKRKCGCAIIFVQNIDSEIKYRQDPDEKIEAEHPCKLHKNGEDWKTLSVHEVLEERRKFEGRVIE